MSRQNITKLVSVSTLGLLVLGFGFLLLIVLTPRLLPSHSDFIFTVSRRTFNVAVVTLFVGIVAVLFLFVRALRGRHLK
jgi:hypothetical protein